MAKKNKGILLLAFGKKGYAESANNLAYTIKRLSGVHITLAVQPELLNYIFAEDYQYWDNIVELKEADYITDGKIDPAKAKVSVYDIGSKYYKEFIYLDVDAMCWQNIDGLFDQCSDSGKFYVTDVKGVGEQDEVINYSIWASNEDIVDFFDLKKKDKIYAIQSSWAYFKVCQEAKDFMTEVKKYFKKGFDKKKLLEKWGGTLPDELIFSGVLSKMGIDASHNFYPEPIHFGNKHPHKGFTDLAKDTYIMSTYGNGNGQTLTKTSYFEYYDRQMIEWKKEELKGHKYKIGQINKDKHANGH
jgi:hypothetical protein